MPRAPQRGSPPRGSPSRGSPRGGRGPRSQRGSPQGSPIKSHAAGGTRNAGGSTARDGGTSPGRQQRRTPKAATASAPSSSSEAKAEDPTGPDSPFFEPSERIFYRSEPRADAFSAIVAQIAAHDFKPDVRRELLQRLTNTLGEIVSREKQLQDIGGSAGKLSLRYRQDWQENEAALAMIPYVAVDVAHRHEDLFANNFHDPLTLLKSRQFYGRLLQLVVGTPNQLLWGSADLDYFKVVNDYWCPPPAHSARRV